MTGLINRSSRFPIYRNPLPTNEQPGTMMKPEKREIMEFPRAFELDANPFTEKSFPGLEIMSLVDSHPICEGILQQNSLLNLFKETSEYYSLNSLRKRWDSPVLLKRIKQCRMR
jgi:hypothetical protein